MSVKKEVPAKAGKVKAATLPEEQTLPAPAAPEEQTPPVAAAAAAAPKEDDPVKVVILKLFRDKYDHVTLYQKGDSAVFKRSRAEELAGRGCCVITGKE